MKHAGSLGGFRSLLPLLAALLFGCAHLEKQGAGNGSYQYEIGKAFDASAPCGPLQPASKIGHPGKGRITLKCNGKVRQDGDLEQLIWNVPEIISKLSEMVALEAGDIIMTGTPSGVGFSRTPPEFLKPGDVVECEIEGIGTIRNTVG